MRPIFCGNFEYETRKSDLERLFSKYGRVDRVDMKSAWVAVSLLRRWSISRTHIWCMVVDSYLPLFRATQRVARSLPSHRCSLGTCILAVTSPELVRTRMVVGIGSKNIYGSFIQIIEQQVWQGLWAGNAINMIRIVPTQAIELGTFEYVKRAMTLAQEDWNQTESPKLQIGSMSLRFSLSRLSPIAVAGAAAGIVRTIVCHPLEVLKVCAGRFVSLETEKM